MGDPTPSFCPYARVPRLHLTLVHSYKPYSVLRTFKSTARDAREKFFFLKFAALKKCAVLAFNRGKTDMVLHPEANGTEIRGTHPRTPGRIERLSSPRRNTHGVNDRRYELELKNLRCEMAHADRELTLRDDLVVVQKQAHQEQLDELRAQMHLGVRVSFAAATAASIARAGSERQVSRMRDLVARLRSQVAALKSSSSKADSRPGNGTGC